MNTIPYTTNNTPTETGVYACRVRMQNQPISDKVVLYDDIFLMWYKGQWWYVRSDQKYRGTVAGWIGPLQRKLDV